MTTKHSESDHTDYKYDPDDQLPQHRPAIHRRVGRFLVRTARTLVLWWGIGVLTFIVSVTLVHTYNRWSVSGPATLLYATAVLIVVAIVPVAAGAFIDVTCRLTARRFWGRSDEGEAE